MRRDGEGWTGVQRDKGWWMAMEGDTGDGGE